MRKSRVPDEQIAMASRQAESGTIIDGICRKLEVRQQPAERPGAQARAHTVR